MLPCPYTHWLPRVLSRAPVVPPLHVLLESMRSSCRRPFLVCMHSFARRARFVVSTAAAAAPDPSVRC
jgi:hypothetical protein